MNPRKRDVVVKALIRKGFQRSDTDHVKLYYINSSGKKTRVWTKASHGAKQSEISPSNLRKMAKQYRLSDMDFEKLIDYPLSRKKYEDMLITAGEIAAAQEK